MRARGIDPGTAAVGWCDIDRSSPGVFHFVSCGTWDPADIVRGWSAVESSVDVYSIETPEEMHANDVMAAIRSSYEDKTMRGGRGGSSFTTGFSVGAARIVKTVKGLIETRALAERIACGIAAAGGRIVEPTAAECRRALGVKFGAQRGKGVKLTPDQQVKEKLHLYIRGWPERSNVHVRDAGAAAFLALVMTENAVDVETAVRLALAGARS